jgi:hypothetical protein
MLLIILGAFVIASVIIEFQLIAKFPALGRLAGRNRLVGVSLSVGLSWILGQLFAASGAIVLIGSIASSVITQPIHAFRVRRDMYARRVRLYRAMSPAIVRTPVVRLRRRCSARLGASGRTRASFCARSVSGGPVPPGKPEPT